jgi:hypothetical protein
MHLTPKSIPLFEFSSIINRLISKYYSYQFYSKFTEMLRWLTRSAAWQERLLAARARLADVRRVMGLYGGISHETEIEKQRKILLERTDGGNRCPVCAC